jgi:hypothetical protein
MINNYDCHIHILSFLNYRDLLFLNITNKENNILVSFYIKDKLNLISNVFRNYKYNKNLRKKMKHQYSLKLLRFKPFLISNIIENSYFFRCTNSNNFIDLIIKLLGNKKYQLNSEQFIKISNYFNKKISFIDMKNILKNLNIEQLLRIS